MILLDTHAFYWYMCDKDRLTPAIMNAIETAERVCVSIATFWEMTIKYSLGKLNLPVPLSSMMESCGQFQHYHSSDQRRSFDLPQHASLYSS